MIIILICSQNAIAQEMRSLTGVECAEADYKIKIGDVFFDANKTGYVCSGSLPVVVSIYSKKTNNPITAKDVIWIGKIDSSYGAIYEAKLTLSNFDLKDVMEISMSFTENGMKETINKFIELGICII